MCTSCKDSVMFSLNVWCGDLGPCEGDCVGCAPACRGAHAALAVAPPSPSPSFGGSVSLVRVV